MYLYIIQQSKTKRREEGKGRPHIHRYIHIDDDDSLFVQLTRTKEVKMTTGAMSRVVHTKKL
jgi:hypothetical protein